MQAYQGGDLLGALVLSQWVSKVVATCTNPSSTAACASLKSQANGFAYSITNNLDSAGNTPTYTYINTVSTRSFAVPQLFSPAACCSCTNVAQMREDRQQHSRSLGVCQAIRL